MSEPTTEAGRAMNRWRVAIKADEDWRTLTDAIAAIEREARTQALAAVRAACDTVIATIDDIERTATLRHIDLRDVVTDAQLLTMRAILDTAIATEEPTPPIVS